MRVPGIPPFTPLFPQPNSFKTSKPSTQTPPENLDPAATIKTGMQMNASARAAVNHAPNDTVYTLRDDLARAHSPANAHERMLITAIAQAWIRLQAAYDLERRLFEKTDPLELLSNDLERFKVIARHISECERIWRRAVEELERAKRKRIDAVTGPYKPSRTNVRAPIRTERVRPDLPEPAPESDTLNPLPPCPDDSA